MIDGRSIALRVAVEALHEAGVSFVLVHESALMGWNIDNNVFLNNVDVLLFHDEDFHTLGCKVPRDIGQYVQTELDGMPTRLWSRESLRIKGSFEVTTCIHYDCEALAPELVLLKLPYSPDAPLLTEQRARLAAIIMVDELSDEELWLVAHYVRGD